MIPCWDLCGLGPQEPIRYRHEYAYVRVIGTQSCGVDDDGNQIDGCPVYIRENFITSAEGVSPCLPYELEAPGLGEVLLMRVTVFDEADNADCGKCPCDTEESGNANPGC